MTSFSNTNQSSKDRLLTMLAKEAYRYGAFTLSSGRESNHYVNCKPVSLSGFGLQLISYSLLEYVESSSKAVAGLTLGADPLVSGVAMAAAQNDRGLNALIVRKEAKSHGTGQSIEGPLPSTGSLVTVLEDVVTTGESSLKAVRALRSSGFLIQRVIAIVDREEGAANVFEKEGLELVTLFCLKEVALRARELNQ